MLAETQTYTETIVDPNVKYVIIVLTETGLG
jgi:hypothetical protein